MNTHEMKKFAFTIQAVKAKGYDIEKLLALAPTEIQKLPLSNTLILALLSMQEQQSPTSYETLKDVLHENTRSADEAVLETVTRVESDYKPEAEIVLPEITPEAEVQTEVLEVLEEAPPAEPVEVKKDAVVEVERKIYSAEQLGLIREVLAKKELRTAAAFMKLLSTEVPAALLKEIDGSTLTELCNERVREVKGK